MKRILSLTSLLICVFSSLTMVDLSAEGTKKPNKDDILAKWDANGDGELNPQEKAAMKKAMKKAMFERMDKDGSGSISLEEWMSFEPKRRARS